MGAIAEWIPSVLRYLWPRQVPDEHPRLYMWRVAITVFVISGFAADAFHILAACGWLSPFYEGFAQATSFDRVNVSLDALTFGEARREVREDHFLVCKDAAGKPPNYAALRTDGDNLDVAQERYRLLNKGQALPLEPCDWLLN